MQYRHAAMNIVCMFQYASCISVHVVAGQNVFAWGCAKKTRILYSLYIWAMCVTYLGWINLVSVGLQGSPLFRLQDAVGAEH